MVSHISLRVRELTFKIGVLPVVEAGKEVDRRARRHPLKSEHSS